jgi:hypothetical protein
LCRSDASWFPHRSVTPTTNSTTKNPVREREREREDKKKLGKPDATQSLKQRKGSYNNKQSALARMGCCGSTEETNF